MYGCGESGYNGRMGLQFQTICTQKVKYLRKRLKKNDKIWRETLLIRLKLWQLVNQNWKRTTQQYTIWEMTRLLKSLKQIRDNFNDDMLELKPDCLFESKMIEMRRMWNKIDRGNRGRMNALGFGKVLKLSHVWASDWTLDKIATALAGNVTADVELEDFLQYVGENLRKSILANHFHRLYVRMFCKENGIAG